MSKFFCLVVVLHSVTKQTVLLNPLKKFHPLNKSHYIDYLARRIILSYLTELLHAETLMVSASNEGVLGVS